MTSLEGRCQGRWGETGRNPAVLHGRLWPRADIKALIESTRGAQEKAYCPPEAYVQSSIASTPSRFRCATKSACVPWLNVCALGASIAVIEFFAMPAPFDQQTTDAAPVKRYLPWVVATALFMEQLDSTIVNTAVPAMAASLGVTPLSLKAVVASYIVSLAVGIPISGWIADRFGTRRVFSSAVALFTLASIACGLSVNVEMLVGARILQGLGAAMMTPVGRLAIIRTFDKSELLMAMNFVIIPALIGPLLGPTIGGLIVHWVSWRYIFFVNLPMGIAALLIIHRHMPDYRRDGRRPLDFVGLVLFSTGMAILSWLLEIFGEHEIDMVRGGMMLLLSLVLLAAYVWHTPQGEHPLLCVALGTGKVLDELDLLKKVAIPA